jgi:hypothetical protein
MSPNRDTDIGDAELPMPDLFIVVNIPKMLGSYVPAGAGLGESGIYTASNVAFCSLDSNHCTQSAPLLDT